ncbi:hypothetical protein QBC39DRAFT_342269 [Podospora conica]|nr:hypothetical protein QBC39DRAFT_342269 [Schizothecium conicum]
MHPLKAITALAITPHVLALPHSTPAPRPLEPRGCAFSSYDGCFHAFKAGCVSTCMLQPMDQWLVCISLCDRDIEKSCGALGCFPSRRD